MKTRIYFLDNLRTFLILLVVVIHSGLVYEQVLQNTWIVVDSAKADSIGLIRMYLDLFVMFTIFFISGYFIPASVKKQSPLNFIKSKFKRIILPWFIAVVTLIPAYKFIFLYSRGLPQEVWYSYFHIFERSGSDLSVFSNNPVQNWLWFLPVLFVFQLIYLGLSKTKLLKLNMSISIATILSFVIGVVYTVSIAESGLQGWYHSALLHFQRERLLIYFLAFLLGTLCYSKNVFESSNKNRRLYIIANVVLTIALGLFTAVALNLFFNLIDPQRNHYFISVFGDRVAYYALALLSQLSILYVLLYSFRHSLNKTNALLAELNRNSYATYIIHTVVMGVIALPMMHMPIPTYIKFITLSVLSFTLSNMLIYSYRLTIQKQINMKTITTAVLALFICGAAFAGFPENNKKTTVQLTETSVPQNPSLHGLVLAGDLEGVKQALKNGADINEKDQMGGGTPLITATVFDKTEIAKALIEAGANLNLVNNDGSTALHTAAFFCRTEIVKALLENGADKSIKNNGGATALESVIAPFEMVRGIYEYMESSLKPLGLELDMNRIETTRPVIAKILSK